MTRRAWTRKEVDRLGDLLADGMTYSQAGKVLGRTWNATAKAADRYGLSGPVYEKNPAYVRVYREIGSIAGVAKHFGVCGHTVRLQLRRQGVRLLTLKERAAFYWDRRRELHSEAVQDMGWPDVSAYKLRYLDALYGKSMTVAEATAVIDTDYRTAARNLLWLFRAGHVTRTCRDGRSVYTLSEEVEAARRAYLTKEEG